MKGTEKLTILQFRAMQLQPATKKSKYNAIKVESDGITFDSKKEKDRYCELKLLQNAKQITGLQRQVPFVLEGSNYIADFVYFDYALKSFIVEDTKGFRTQVYRMKKKAMLERYGIALKES